MKLSILTLSMALALTGCGDDEEQAVQRPIGAPSLQSVTIEGNAEPLNGNAVVYPNIDDGQFIIEYESTGFNYLVGVKISDSPAAGADDDILIGARSECLVDPNGGNACNQRKVIACYLDTSNVVGCTGIADQDLSGLLDEIPKTLYVKTYACSSSPSYCTNQIIVPLEIR